MDKNELSVEIAAVLNKHNIDTAADMPDFVLSDMLVEHLKVFLQTLQANKRWHADDAAEDLPQTAHDAATGGGFNPYNP